MTNYATLPQVKAAAGIGPADTDDDAALELALASASRTVDGYCERRFFTNGTEVRVYAAQWPSYVDVDDIAGTAIAVATSSSLGGAYETVWADSDWQAEPLNRLASGLAFPTTRLRAVQDYAFPVSTRGEAAVQVTAVFGFGTVVPEQVSYATTLLALRQWTRFKSPQGVVGFGDMGPIRISRTDPDVATMLQPFRKNPVGFA